MKRLLLGLGAVLLVGAAVAWSGKKGPPQGLDFAAEERNPVTHTRLAGPDTFQFAVVSDRTGGHRARVFARAVEQLNLLQPEFVVSVGDLIEGYTTDRARLDREWREFQGYVGRLQMPFFYAPGNHDMANASQVKLWREKFGRSYYEFVYKNVLFLVLNSEDPPGAEPARFTREQRDWLKKVLAANAGVRWTMVFLHKPAWVYSQEDIEKRGWQEIEKALEGRRYTVFAGHVHRFQKFRRHGQDYYMLATTGGGSKMRGTEYGELDHVFWVTMTPRGPVLASIGLDGVLRENLEPIVTEEEGVLVYNRRPTHPTTAKVVFNGRSVPGAFVVFTPKGKPATGARADGLTGPDGTVRLTTYTAFDGAALGDYAVTVVLRQPYWSADGRLGANKLPPRYASAATTPLEATVRSGRNAFIFELTDAAAEGKP